ncbi:MAG: TonB family protein [Deltaproteobacteria bacterium]|nr:TonB family protein [Deltaproteobacteria bacterium]
MANDERTASSSSRQARECPTCGQDIQPGEQECRVCGTLIRHGQSLPELFVDDSEPTVVAPLPTEASEPTIAELPVRPLADTRIGARPISLPPPASASSSPAFPPLSPPSPSPGPSVARPAIAFPSTPLKSNGLAKWGGIGVGVLALVLVGFFVTKMFSTPDEKKETERTLSDPTVTVPAETRLKVGGESATEKKTEALISLPPTPQVATPQVATPQVATPQVATPQVAAPPMAPPPPSLVGRVTTAEQLLPLRVFGADENDVWRGVAAFRIRVEENLSGIRETYNTHLVKNPQSLGTAIIEFSVAPVGQVTSAVVHCTGTLSRELQQGIMQAARAWKFPPAQGDEVKVFYPLLLSPEKIEEATLLTHVKEVWPGRYKVLAATSVPVRSQASDSAEQIGTLGVGLFLSVVNSQDGWLGALSPKGKVGYVRQDAIFPRRVENTATSSADAKG